MLFHALLMHIFGLTDEIPQSLCAGCPRNVEPAWLFLRWLSASGKQAATSAITDRDNGCFLDITVPTWMNADDTEVKSDEVLGWRKRHTKLFFRYSAGCLAPF